MKVRVLYIDHTRCKSGATISLGLLLRSLSSVVQPYYLLRTRNQSEAVLAGVEGPKFYERWLPQFVTTVYGKPYSPFLILWHFVKMPIAFLHLHRLRRKWEIDLIHVNETNLVPYVYFGWILKIPVVMHARTVITRRWFERALLSSSGHYGRLSIIAIDEEVRSSLPQSCQEKTTIIHNPIDLGPSPSPKETTALRASWGCNSEGVVIGQVASLHSQKGIWQILELSSLLCPKYPSVIFVLVGDDSPETGEGPRLREAIGLKGLQERIILAGYRTDLSLVYGAFDIALCLFGKGLGGVGRTAYEAALAGRPLVATIPDPANTSTVSQNGTGLFFHPDDEDGILKALVSLIESKQARISLGDRAKSMIGERHEPRFVADRVRRIYGDLVDTQTCARSQ